MTHPLFFGYGSLVNTATHDYPNPRRATLTGYRRVWRHTSLRPVAFLSVEPAADSRIEGLVAEVPHGDWAALDLRESAYTRRDVTALTTHDGPANPVAVYAVSQGHLSDPAAAHPILLSYIDVVVQGYLRHFGPAGAQAFFDSTSGWSAPIHDDRANPLYPRAQSLTADETAFTDAALARVRG
ncbi:gamma-glutamylcyclotransferase family protein [Flavimaricola marinus]|uniref:ChaC-like protein n=1 Tax=Flavimaricola marinus TaxID=1819565 RepID=A0A238LIV2_9RHOB|nr:gamma-glutamylcyclotransferase family protein [Flavimaricola marinus]SMY08800.1 ChaC-like protein [Flavimaricola marinus]